MHTHTHTHTHKHVKQSNNLEISFKLLLILEVRTHSHSPTYTDTVTHAQVWTHTWVWLNSYYTNHKHVLPLSLYLSNLSPRHQIWGNVVHLYVYPRYYNVIWYLQMLIAQNVMFYCHLYYFFRIFYLMSCNYLFLNGI